MAGEEPRSCSRDGCESKLPSGTEIPPGWTICRVEAYGVEKVTVYYLYICNGCVLSADKKQGQLFEGENEVSR